MYNGARRNNSESASFLAVVRLRCGDAPLNFDAFAGVAILHPLIVDFFLLDEISL
jgi:hypothetical protein